MNTFIIKTFSINNIVVDFFLLCIAYFIPTISHVLTFPLYIFDPMRIILLIGLLMTKNKNNSLVMAVSIPFFSTLVAGHPLLMKSLLIGIELTTNILLFLYILNKAKLHVFFAIFGSIVLSKIVYYSFKFLFLKLGILDGNLISTPLLIQFFVALIIAIVFCIIWLKGKDFIAFKNLGFKI